MTALRVLYAEDDTSTRVRVTEFLTQELGLGVADHGVLKEAKAVYASDKFDAVILDGKLQEYCQAKSTQQKS